MEHSRMRTASLNIQTGAVEAVNKSYPPSDHSSEEDASSDSSDASDDYAESDFDEDGDHVSTKGSTEDTIAQESVIKSSKVTIFVILFLAAIASALTTTYLLRLGEYKAFRKHVRGFSLEIANQSQGSLNRSATALRSLSRTITNHAIETNTQFPFVTLPNFEVYGGEARELAGAEVVIYAPLVNTSELPNWETYSVDHQSWLVEALSNEGMGSTNPGSIPSRLHIRYKPPHNHEDKGEVHMESFHLPIWQMAGAPRNASIVNLDLIGDDSRFEHDVYDVWQRRLPLLSSSSRNLQYLTENAGPGQVEDVNVTRVDTGKSAVAYEYVDPISRFELPRQSYILYPVFEEAEAGDNSNNAPAVTSAETTASDPAKVVGFVLAVIQWEALFSNILPSDVESMLVVVHDGCGDVFSMSLRGPKAYFVGRGDFHDEAFDTYMFTIADFGGLAAAGFDELSLGHTVVNGTTYNQRYEGTSIGHCEVRSSKIMWGYSECLSTILIRSFRQYTLQIYPTSEIQMLYAPNKLIAPVAVVLIFFTVIVLLLFYDCMVIGKQRKLIEEAKRMNEIVGSFFPKAVRKRMMEDAARQAKSAVLADAAQIEELWGDLSQTELDVVVKKESLDDDKPIADYFPSTTLIFADLVGFTAWSSTRDPSHVFMLLETIFQKFDAIATRRKIFKVETVGDCYVAATGLPVRNKNHAVAMARFARECMAEFGRQIKQLEIKLGPDTADLGLRIGKSQIFFVSRCNGLL
jgi:hypothetical protein